MQCEARSQVNQGESEGVDYCPRLKMSLLIYQEIAHNAPPQAAFYETIVHEIRKYYPFIPKGNLRKIGINAILYNMFAFPAGFSPANISTGFKFEGFYL